MNREQAVLPPYWSYPQWTVVEFEKPFLLELDALTKIAGAISIRSGFIAVEKQNGKYYAWGIIDKGAPSYRSFSYGQHNMLPPATLTVTTLAPANLIITHGDLGIGRFIKGNFHLLQASVFRSTDLGKYILQEIEQHEHFDKPHFHYWHLYVEMLEILLSETSKRSHGAAIIWVPEKSLPSVEEKITKKYSITTSASIMDTVAELAKMYTQQKYDDVFFNPIKRTIVEYLGFLAQLASIDGALVITDKFIPVSFGTKLNAGSWQGDILNLEIDRRTYHPQGKGFTLPKIDIARRYGTRHRSAMDLTGACDGIISFVLSQDGPIRAFKKANPETIFFWPDCTTSVFVSDLL